MISKYPVIGKYFTYQVDIEKHYICLNTWEWRIKLYEDRKDKKWYQSKSKLVYRLNTGWYTYHDWEGKYVQLAKYVVNSYENKLEDIRKKELQHTSGLKEWKEWDGKL